MTYMLSEDEYNELVNRVSPREQELEDGIKDFMRRSQFRSSEDYGALHQVNTMGFTINEKDLPAVFRTRLRYNIDGVEYATRRT